MLTARSVHAVAAARGLAAQAQPAQAQPRDADDEGTGTGRRAAPASAAAAQRAQHQELLDQLQEREIRIAVPWGHVAGTWWGRADRRPLVALHGYGDNAASFERLAGALRGVPVLALDLPGHGLSAAPRGLAPPDRGLLLAALRRVQRALGLTAMSLVGHSLGDAVALLYAATYPNDVDMYVSLDTLVPSPVDADAEVKSSGALTDDLLEAEAEAEAEAEGAASAHTQQAQQLAELLSSRGGSLNRHAAETLLRRAVEPRVLRAPVLGAGLALACARAVRCPTLCVLPEWRAPRALAADAELRARFLADLRMAAKTVTAVAVAGTHHAHLNSPEVVVPALQDFLDQHYSRQPHAVPGSTFTA